ncbi:MAG TPA: hypothetical protein P5037_08325 [Candidatus Paceibacterota bacterium]|jgi:hypothetical protein|nr:hypothetical protein [Verrucomicrobiota bacterium]HRY58836.1 hypothetical protein [Candidatus Paceibacterota bacterium]HQE89758.1 hypothetical protein [Verrucomicrobiota bacterium]HQH02228.1 hypothetical protein [Verrucomicrobiota bacterium]HRD03640.1 hypothetical protein [Verrucomicrobiota bacterium]
MFLVWALGGTFPSVAQLSLEAFGDPFDGKRVEIVWTVPTNKLPQSLNTMRVLPAVFTDEVVSNVISLCEFKEPEQVRLLFRPVTHGKEVSYQEPQPEKPVLGKSLRIYPADGYINYLNPKAEALPRSRVEGVPDEAEALSLAVRLLPKLGINQDELAHKPDGKQLEFLKTSRTMGKFVKNAKEPVEQVIVRGVILFRQINNVAFSGAGDCDGLRVEFGNNAQIKELALTWRNLRTDKTVTLASPDQIVQRIKGGKAVIRLPEPFANLQLVKKLTIIDARPYYFAFVGGHRQKIVYPYVMLTADADLGFTNQVAWLNCPIVK